MSDDEAKIINMEICIQRAAYEAEKERPVIGLIDLHMLTLALALLSEDAPLE